MDIVRTLSTRRCAMSDPLLLDAQGCADLIGTSERSFHELRRRAEFPRAVMVYGPRRPRWRRHDIIAWVASLPAIENVEPEPKHLAASRERRRGARS